MPRPTKSNADYFRHDNDMRNDPKIKALRTRFGLEGYAVWNMLLETLTDADGFAITWDALAVELFAGDFCIPGERLTEIVDYLARINLMQIANGALACANLSKRLVSVVEKREKMQKNYFLRISAAETTHNIREDKRGEESIREDINTPPPVRAHDPPPSPAAKNDVSVEIKNTPLTFDPATERATWPADGALREAFAMVRKIPADHYERYIREFAADIAASEQCHRDRQDLRKHFLSWSEIHYRTETKPPRSGKGSEKSAALDRTAIFAQVGQIGERFTEKTWAWIFQAASEGAIRERANKAATEARERFLTPPARSTAGEPTTLSNLLPVA